MRSAVIVAVVVAAAAALVPARTPAHADGPEAWRIPEAVRYVAGREPTIEEHKVDHFGTWSSYGDLCNKVRAKLTGQGAAYVFIKPNQAGHQGHIGWGFLLDDGRYLCGSTENPYQEDHPERALYIKPGDDNGYWSKTCTTEDEMLRTMATATPRGSSGYWHYKSTTVLTRNSSAAVQAADACKASGFHGVGNNCLDQTLRVLQAYGTGASDNAWGRVLPVINQWALAGKEGERPVYVPVPGFTKITPNDWFNNFGYIAVAERKACNGSGSGDRLPGVGATLACHATVGKWFEGEMALTADPAEPSMIRLQPWDHLDHQQWYFDSDAKNPGYYFISNRAANRDAAGNWLVLDVPRGTTDCVFLGLWAHHGGDNQLWALEGWPADRPERWAIRNKMTGQYLSMNGWKTEAGTGLVQFRNAENATQRWVFR